jgi:hypothetical protein
MNSWLLVINLKNPGILITRVINLNPLTNNHLTIILFSLLINFKVDLRNKSDQSNKNSKMKV